MKEDKDLYKIVEIIDEETGEITYSSQIIRTNKEGRKQLIEAMKKALLGSIPMTENEQWAANEAIKRNSSKTPTINDMF